MMNNEVVLSDEEIQTVVRVLTEEVGGDWVLLGGALTRLAYDPSRSTRDVDLVAIPRKQESEESLLNRLYQCLATTRLGPEVINSAVKPFLSAAEGWQEHVSLLRVGSIGRILQPSLTLFLFLKLQRASVSDLNDIRSAIHTRGATEFDARVFHRWASPSLWSRFESLRADLGL
jgi:hypothetical protein